MACTHASPALYGLGVRLAIYVNWAAAATFNYIDQSVLPDIRLSTLVLSSSVTISLLCHLSASTLSPAEIYILVLLSTGPTLFLLPVYVWRACTGWKPYWSPQYWSDEGPLRVFRFLTFVTTLTSASAAVYFFTTAAKGECTGFLFNKVALDFAPFVAFNAVVYVSVVAVCVLIAVFKSGFLVSGSRFERDYPQRCRRDHLQFLFQLQFLSDVTVWAVLVAAIELTIQWNDISNVNDLSTTSQLVCLLGSIAVAIRAVWRHNWVEESSDDWPMTQDEWAAAREQYQTSRAKRRKRRF